jgi:membrane fusion protein, multidrug efflux system
VTLAPAQIKTVPVTFEYVGLTGPSKKIDVRARIQGFIDTRDFVEGSYVEEGTRLYTIDPRTLKADRQIAAAQVDQAEARVHLAEQEVKRMRSVTKPGAIAQNDLDQKVAEQSTATAALRLAKAQLAKAELDLSYTTVTAPLTGYIGKTFKETGSLVDSGQNSLLAEMEQVDPIYVSFKMSESDFLVWRGDLGAGRLVFADGKTQPYIEIVLLDGTTYPKQGEINFENVDLDVKTGTVEIRATLENAERTLKPGQFVKVCVKGMNRPNVLVVPQRAVSQSPEGAYVYVVGTDNKAERRNIKEGSWAEQDWIVLDGLKEGEQVIVEGLTKVRSGVVVAWWWRRRRRVVLRPALRMGRPLPLRRPNRPKQDRAQR